MPNIIDLAAGPELFEIAECSRLGIERGVAGMGPNRQREQCSNPRNDHGQQRAAAGRTIVVSLYFFTPGRI
ncbi:MAG: hypothetical protein EPN77_19225 [Candidimonas sp.]|nr:MAG: hypothetical protein EPN77_19225 [Candidimonas sp.]